MITPTTASIKKNNNISASPANAPRPVEAWIVPAQMLDSPTTIFIIVFMFIPYSQLGGAGYQFNLIRVFYEVQFSIDC